FASRFFFFAKRATTELYTRSLHDALPIFRQIEIVVGLSAPSIVWSESLCFGPKQPVNTNEITPKQAARNTHRRIAVLPSVGMPLDRKSTRLNSSHVKISYAVFCLKKKTTT